MYQEALAKEFLARGINYRREFALPVAYKGMPLDASYFADFVRLDEVIVELKALDAINGTHESQLLNYLKASGHRTGLLLNFGARSLEQPRLVL